MQSSVATPPAASPPIQPAQPGSVDTTLRHRRRPPGGPDDASAEQLDPLPPLDLRQPSQSQPHGLRSPAASPPARAAHQYWLAARTAGSAVLDQVWAPRAAAKQNFEAAAAYLARPAVQAVLKEMLHTAAGIAVVGAGGWGLHAIGITPALLGVFGGDSGIEEMAASLPWIGSALGTVLKSVDIYGATAIWMLMAALDRCLNRQEAGDDRSTTPWWALHAALAFALSPLATAGAATTMGLLACTAIGTGILSLTASQSIEQRRDPGSERMPIIFGLALSMAPMGASLMQKAPANVVLRRALSLPVLIGVGQLLYRVGFQLIAAVNTFFSNDAALKPLSDTRRAFFVGGPGAPQRPKATDLMVRMPEAPGLAEGFESWLSYWHEAIHSDRLNREQGKCVLWLTGRPHDGRRTAVKAMANALRVAAFELKLAGHTDDERAQELDRALAHAVSIASHPKKYILVYIGDLDQLAPKNVAGNKNNPLRAKLLDALDTKSGRYADASIIFVVSTEPGSLEAGTNLDAAAASRSGLPVSLLPWRREDWQYELGRLLYAAVQKRPAGLFLSDWWRDYADPSAIGQAYQAAVSQAVEQHWTVTDGTTFAIETAKSVGIAFKVFRDGHDEQNARSFPFVRELASALKASCRTRQQAFELSGHLVEGAESARAKGKGRAPSSPRQSRSMERAATAPLAGG